MATKLFFCFILTCTLMCISVDSFSNYQKNSIHLTYEQGGVRQRTLSRFRRQSPVLGFKNMQAAAVQPSVVVMPSGVPNTVYRGSGASYGVASPYALQSPYGVNRAPTVVVNLPESSSCNKKKSKKKKKIDA